MTKPKRHYKTTKLENIRNRNEGRVLAAMEKVLPEFKTACYCDICVADIYAATLNSLPAHYVQHGGITLRSAPERNEDVENAVRDSIRIVQEQPNHT